MIYNKYNNDYKKILLKLDMPCHEYLKKQASMHDISTTYLINKILKKYIDTCKKNIISL